MIRKLPQSVINKIAAGEVIQRPYNVIKQLLENSIDAGATSIHVKVIQGGIKLIEITDNGQGIAIADFPLLCERFATSKLSQLDDLATIQSFGFRGEALASLSYVSQLEVMSKFKDESLGYRCEFKEQKMIDEPSPVPMNGGTKITAKQLFGTLETRRSSLSPTQQKKRIYKLIGHFALHYSNIKFTLQTQKGTQLSSDFRKLKISQAKMKVFQTLTKLPYDKFSFLPKHFLQGTDQKPVDQAKVQSIITKLNTVRGKVLLLNVNNRIVQNPQIFKAVERAYSDCYQSIHEDNQSFYVYLALEVDQKKIDCNQHPSKKIIGFFGADRLFEAIYHWINKHIKEQSSIKNIAANPTKQKPTFNINRDLIFGTKTQSQTDFVVKSQDQTFKDPSNLKPTYAFDKNRTDAKQMPINFYIKKNQSTQNKVKQGHQLIFNFKSKEQQQPEQQYIRQFFKHTSYVGCFNLNFIFVHFENRLYMLNIVPFLRSFVKEWLKINPLTINNIVDQYRFIDLGHILRTFLKNKKLQAQVEFSKLLQNIIMRKEEIYKQYGIKLLPLADESNALITSFPVLQSFMVESLIQDELAYFLSRSYVREVSPYDQQEYFIDFLVSLFEEDPSKQSEQIKIEQGPSRKELSPLNDKYSEFMRDQVIPLLKTKCRHYSPISILDYLSQMLDLKDVYKIFERC